MMSVGHVFRSLPRSHVGSHDHRSRDHGVTNGDKELRTKSRDTRINQRIQGLRASR